MSIHDTSEIARRARSLLKTGDLTQAKALCEQICRINKEDVDAWVMLGKVHMRLGKFAEAEACCHEAIKRRSGVAEAHFVLGNALQSQRKWDESIASYRQALKLEPDFAKAYYRLGDALNARGRSGEAISNYQRATIFQPNFTAAHNKLGVALEQQGRFEEAVAAYQKILAIAPNAAGTYGNLCNVYTLLGDLDSAEASIRQALRLEPDSSVGYNNLGNVLKEQGRIEEATVCFRRALELKPDFVIAHSNLLMCLNYLPACSPAELLEAHKVWARLHAAASGSVPVYRNPPDPGRRLRIGYVSPDFRHHPVAAFLEPILKHHDSAAFDVICYANVARPDSATEHLRSLGRGWRNTYGLSDSQLVEMIRSDGIDILVDLAGHTGDNRLPVFSARPAPVQVTYLGYPNTTGLSSIDYRLTDEVSDPVGDERYYTEKLCYLRNGFSCYAPPVDVPEVALSPPCKNGTVTFGSFNNLLKINASVIDLWCRVLQSNPSARMIILRHVLRGKVRERMYQAFSQRGIARERINLLCEVPEECRSAVVGRSYFALYQHIDIALDTFPWNGHTMSCETLWMGVPVVTLYGDRHAGRLCASVLTAIGLPQLIAYTPDEYVRIATELANNPGELERLRAGLRDRMRNSPLCDGKGFTEILEQAYREMWSGWCLQSADTPGERRPGLQA